MEETDNKQVNKSEIHDFKLRERMESARVEKGRPTSAMSQLRQKKFCGLCLVAPSIKTKWHSGEAFTRGTSTIFGQSVEADFRF